MKELKDVILFQIDQTSKVSKQYSQREFEKLNFGITVEQWILLKIISESEQLSQKELAVKSFRDPASITRTLDILEQKNFVIRESIPKNRRAYNISLSKEATKFIKKNIAVIKKHREKSTKGFSLKELSLLSSMLKRIQKNMN